MADRPDMTTFLSSPEKRVGARAMPFGMLDPSSDAVDLGLQRYDSRLEFGDGQRIEILGHESLHQIAGARGWFVRLHDQDR